MKVVRLGVLLGFAAFALVGDRTDRDLVDREAIVAKRVVDRIVNDLDAGRDAEISTAIVQFVQLLWAVHRDRFGAADLEVHSETNQTADIFPTIARDEDVPRFEWLQAFWGQMNPGLERRTGKRDREFRSPSHPRTWINRCVFSEQLIR